MVVGFLSDGKGLKRRKWFCKTVDRSCTYAVIQEQPQAEDAT